jgi:DNA helicase-2/ATP-dependent DNA helicase PcrA
MATAASTRTSPPRRPAAGAGLNEAQAKAVNAPAGPLLVLAGAGTGKTRVVIARIVNLVKRGTPPDRILAVTFTNKAAREMVARIGNRFGGRGKKPATGGKENPPPKPEVSTIHSLCVRILRRHAQVAGYPDRFVIVDRGEQETTARKVLKELRVAEATLRPGELLDRISRWKSRGVRAEVVFDTLSTDADDSWDLAAAGYQRYQRAMRGNGAVDFDDLLLVVDQLFTEHEQVRQQEAGRFDHLLVDEYQDTSGIQERILSALARDHKSFCVVGDDDQSIYAWRGAQISHILEFPSRWPGATVVRLEENYRSTPEIIEAANTLIACNTRRHGKKLVSQAASGLKPAIVQAQDEVDEARRVTGDAEALLRERVAPPSEMAILVRTGEQTRVFETELRHRNIPYELVGSRSFFDRREVKDVLSYLRLLVDQEDDLALSRIANVPPRGLSYNALEKARKDAAEGGRSLWSALLEARNAGRLSAAAAGGVAKLEALIRMAPAAGNAAGVGSAADSLRQVLEQSGYRNYLAKEFEDEAEQEARWQSVEELVNGLARHEQEHRGTDPATTVRRYLDDLILEVKEAERFEEDKTKGNKLKLMTLHAAKGLEFDCVWMVGMEENLLPHIRAVNEGLPAIDEERRLCYVGVTRARKRLMLSLALTQMKWGKAKPSKPSRFLYELTGQADKFVEGPAEPREKVGAKPRKRR